MKIKAAYQDHGCNCIKFIFKPYFNLNPYVYPTKDELDQMGLDSIFLFYFLKYDIYENLDFVKKHGFSVDERPKEGTYTNWENLDEKYTGTVSYTHLTLPTKRIV